MKRFSILTIGLLIFAILILPMSLQAGGPGFDKNVYTWGSGGDDDGDDDSGGGDDDDSGGGGDDDDSGGGDDDDGYGGGDDDGDDDDGGGSDDDDDNEIPLDGGLSFLAAAGAAFGVKKFRDNSAKRNRNK